MKNLFIERIDEPIEIENVRRNLIQSSKKRRIDLKIEIISGQIVAKIFDEKTKRNDGMNRRLKKKSFLVDVQRLKTVDSLGEVRHAFCVIVQLIDAKIPKIFVFVVRRSKILEEKEFFSASRQKIVSSNLKIDSESVFELTNLLIEFRLEKNRSARRRIFSSTVEIVRQQIENLRTNQTASLHFDHFVFEQIRLTTDSRTFDRHSGGQTFSKATSSTAVARLRIDFTIVLFRTFVMLRNAFANRPTKKTFAALKKKKILFAASIVFSVI